MTSFVLGLVVGLIVGWNFLPQPQWVKNLVDKVVAKVKENLNHAERDAVVAANVREQRTNLLAETDWVVVSHTEKETDIPLEWKVYRQDLRDITEQEGFPHEVTWPTEPE